MACIWHYTVVVVTPCWCNKIPFKSTVFRKFWLQFKPPEFYHFVESRLFFGTESFQIKVNKVMLRTYGAAEIPHMRIDVSKIEISNPKSWLAEQQIISGKSKLWRNLLIWMACSHMNVHVLVQSISVDSKYGCNCVFFRWWVCFWVFGTK